MKQILSFLFLLTSFISNAQFTKGDKLIGGAVSLYTQRAPDSPNGGLTNVVNSFSVNPLIGFLVSEKLAVGGQIGYSYYNTKITNYQPDISEYVYHSFSTGVFARRYFKISDVFFFSVNGLFQFSRGTGTNTNIRNGISSENKMETYDLSTGISPSFIFFPSQKWGFSASVGSLNHSYSKNLTTAAISNNFSFSYGTISLGLAYYIRTTTK